MKTRVNTRQFAALICFLIPVGAAQRGALAQEAADQSVILEPRADSVRPPPIREAGVRWSPAFPEEGSSFGVQVFVPRHSRKPVTVRGRLGEDDVRFGLLGRRWFAVAGIPIGTSGPEQLALTLTYENGEIRTQTISIDIAAREFASTQMSVAPRYSDPPPDVQARIASDRVRIGAALSTITDEWLVDGPFLAPRPIVVTSPFGQRRVFNGELRSRHTGLDLSGEPGESVRATARGRVILADDLYFSGNGVFVDHGLGVVTGYFHLSRILVDEGQMVDAGELIGEVGSTGRVTGPHLHWSLWVDGTGLDAGSLLAIPVP